MGMLFSTQVYHCKYCGSDLQRRGRLFNDTYRADVMINDVSQVIKVSFFFCSPVCMNSYVRQTKDKVVRCYQY